MGGGMLLLFHGWQPSLNRPAPRPPLRRPAGRIATFFEGDAPTPEDWSPFGLVGLSKLPPLPRGDELHKLLGFLFEAEVAPEWSPFGMVGLPAVQRTPGRESRVQVWGFLQDVLDQERRKHKPPYVPKDPKALPRDSNHQQASAGILNSLIRHGELVGTASVGEFDWGYEPAQQEDWSPPPPATVGEAIDRLAALAETLAGGGA